MTTTVFLVRHGSHDRLPHVLCGRMAGVGLGAVGRAQAERLAEAMQGRSLAALYVSPLERARETAAPLAAKLKVHPRIVDELSEVDVGDWAGRRFVDLDGDPLWTAWNSVRSLTRPPGGETMLEVQARAVGWLDRVRVKHRDQRIALFSHGDVIRAMLAYYLGLSLDHLARFEIDPASVSTLIVGDWGAKVHSLNEALGA